MLYIAGIIAVISLMILISILKLNKNLGGAVVVVAIVGFAVNAFIDSAIGVLIMKAAGFAFCLLIAAKAFVSIVR